MIPTLAVPPSPPSSHFPFSFHNEYRDYPALPSSKPYNRNRHWENLLPSETIYLTPKTAALLCAAEIPDESPDDCGVV